MSTDDQTLKLPIQNSIDQTHELNEPIDKVRSIDSQAPDSETWKVIEQVVEQLAAIDEKVDRRLHVTQPLLPPQLEEIREEIKTLKGKVEFLILQNFEIRIMNSDLEKRIQILEAKAQSSE